MAPDGNFGVCRVRTLMPKTVIFEYSMHRYCMQQRSPYCNLIDEQGHWVGPSASALREEVHDKPA